MRNEITNRTNQIRAVEDGIRKTENTLFDSLTKFSTKSSEVFTRVAQQGNDLGQILKQSIGINLANITLNAKNFSDKGVEAFTFLSSKTQNFDQELKKLNSTLAVQSKFLDDIVKVRRAAQSAIESSRDEGFKSGKEKELIEIKKREDEVRKYI